MPRLSTRKMTNGFLMSIALHESGFRMIRTKGPEEAAGLTQIQPRVLWGSLRDALRPGTPEHRAMVSSPAAQQQLGELLRTLGAPKAATTPQAIAKALANPRGPEARNLRAFLETRAARERLLENLNTNVRFQALATVFLWRGMHQMAKNRGVVSATTNDSGRRAIVECFYNAGIRSCGATGAGPSSPAKTRFQAAVLRDADRLDQALQSQQKVPAQSTPRPKQKGAIHPNP